MLKRVLAVLVGLSAAIAAQPSVTLSQYVADSPITSTNPEVDSFLGSSLGSTSASFGLLVIGAPGAGADDSGRAYLYDTDTDQIIATLSSPNATNQGRFGEAVGILPDITGDSTPEVVVGAPQESPGQESNAGAAYIFNGATGDLMMELQTASVNPGRRLGAAVTGVGDIDGGGSPDVLVGAPFETSGGNLGAGKAYIFSSEDGDVIDVLTGGDETVGRFGIALANVGDLVGDSTSDFIVAAPRETAIAGGSPVSEAGRVYLIDGSTFAQTVITSSNVEPGGQFGRSVGAIGSGSDLDLIIGAFNEDPGGQNGAGRAYIFDGADPTGTPRTLIPGQPEENGEFGRSVAGIGDVDGDGLSDVLVGAPGETVNGTDDSGRAYIFSRATGNRLATLETPNPESGRFGTAVTGSERPFVGAPRENENGTAKAGRVYTFSPGINLADGRNGEAYTPPSPSPGTDDNPVGRFRVSVGGAGPSLTSVSISNNAPDPSGVESVELWKSSDGTFDPNEDTELASTAYTSTVSFSGLDASISFDGTYFFLVADLASTVTGDYDPFIIDETNISFDSGVLFSVNGTETSTFTDAFLSDASTPLPVELATFDADVADDRSVRLQWQTTSETGNSGFRVQRSVSGTSWSTLGRVEGAGTTDEPQSYRFTDSSVPYAPDSLRYRLAQVDVDGTVNFSDPVTVRFGNSDRLELLGSFPNPARSQATIRFAVPEQMTGDVQLELYDLLGRQVKTIPAAEASGRVEQTLDVSDLPSGTYLLRLSAGGQTQTQQVTIVR
jgi:hypothetical protein